MTGPTRLVKVVVWDLDGTVWPGVALESEASPEPYAPVVAALDTLAERGILVSVASRNPESVGELVEASPALAGRFVAPQFGWGRKVEALQIYERIIQRRPSMAIGYRNLAFLQWQGGEARAAIQTLERAFRANAIESGMTTQLGSYLAEAGRQPVIPRSHVPTGKEDGHGRRQAGRVL